MNISYICILYRDIKCSASNYKNSDFFLLIAFRSNNDTNKEYLIDNSADIWLFMTRLLYASLDNTL